uniref:UNC-50 family protein n=1 Tax=Oryza punctata TaxID=4537 RepID=A0A0E0LY77_ORYPU
MLPTTASKGRGAARSSPPLFGPYLRRIVKWQQMDIEYTFWQMVHLCTSPKVVYDPALIPFFIVQTKNQWARDDPAFVVILILFLVFATSAYCAAYGESASHAALTITSVVLVHFLFAGIVLATLCWLYAFDVHCNSFFPAFVILYVILIGFNPTRYFLSLYFR